jgi:hypothetical protein
MSSTDTSYSFGKVTVEVGKDEKGKATRQIIESGSYQEKGLKGNVLTAGKAIKSVYSELGWKVSLLKSEDASPTSVGRLYIKAERVVGSATIEVYFTSKIGRDTDNRCETCGATYDFGKKAFCENCKALTKTATPTVEVDW